MQMSEKNILKKWTKQPSSLKSYGRGHVCLLWNGKEKMLFLFFLFMYACQNPSYNQPVSVSDHPVIDLDVPREEAIKASALFKNVKTIILEEDRQSLLGRADAIQLFDGYLYIIDSHIAKTLLVFDLEGKFVRKIGGIGRGPGEYIRIVDFTIDKENKILYILDDLGLKANKYKTTDGSYIGSINMHFGRTNIMSIQFYNNALYARNHPWDDNTDDCLFMKLDPKTGSILEKYLNAAQHNKGWNESMHKTFSLFYNRSGIPAFAHIFMEELISLEGMVPVFGIKSKNMATERDIEAIKQEKDTRKRSLSFTFLPKIHCIRNYVGHKNFIYFHYKYGEEWIGIPVLYDLKTGLIHKGIENDLRFRDGKKRLLLSCSDGKGVFEIIQPGEGEEEMSSFIQEIENNQLASTLDRLEELKKLGEESNPVIFYYEFKDAE
jgi:hypothetical protein